MAKFKIGDRVLRVIQSSDPSRTAQRPGVIGSIVWVGASPTSDIDAKRTDQWYGVQLADGIQRTNDSWLARGQHNPEHLNCECVN